MENRMNWIPVGAVAVLLLAGMIASGITASEEEPTHMGEKCTALHGLVAPYFANGEYNSIADFNNDESVTLADAVIFTSHIYDEEWCEASLPHVSIVPTVTPDPSIGPAPSATPDPTTTKQTINTFSSGGYGGSRFLAKGACFWHKSKNIIEFGLDLPSGMQLTTGIDFTTMQFREVCGLYRTAWKEGVLEAFLSSLKQFELLKGKQ